MIVTTILESTQCCLVSFVSSKDRVWMTPALVAAKEGKADFLDELTRLSTTPSFSELDSGRNSLYYHPAKSDCVKVPVFIVLLMPYVMLFNLG